MNNSNAIKNIQTVENYLYEEYGIEGGIQLSYDYDQFKILKNNRKVNNSHSRNILKSMKKDGVLFNITIVNSYMEIVDGQHRFDPQKKLNKPILFVMIPDYGIDEVHTLNSTTKDWSLNSFLESYLEFDHSNLLEYKKIESFKNHYKWPLTDTIAFMMYGKIDRTREATQPFKEGNFTANYYSLAIEYAGKLKSFNILFSTTTNFLRAAIRIFKTPGYDHNTFLKKLSYKAGILLPGAKELDYLNKFEIIYNNKLRTEKIKIPR